MNTFALTCRQHLDYVVARLWRDHLALTAEVKGIRLSLALRRCVDQKANFNPNQPRVPRGSADGGQWIGVDARANVGGSNRRRLSPQSSRPSNGGSLHWTANRVRDTWRRADEWAEQFVPGGLDTVLAVPDQFNRLLFRLGGPESLRKYEETSQKLSNDFAEAYHYEVNRAVSQGLMTRQQADDATVLVVAAATVGGGKVGKLGKLTAAVREAERSTVSKLERTTISGAVRGASVGRATTNDYRATFFKANPNCTELW